jgi:O-antigen ligase
MLNEFLLIAKKQNNLDRINYLFIFLLPIFSISVRHWASGIATIIFLSSVLYYFINKKNIRPLGKSEKNYIYIFLFYFLVYLLSSLVNGWEKPQTHILGTMLHFIAIIPMLYMFRNMIYALPILAAGSILACISNVIYLFMSGSVGVYSHLFSGPMTLLFCTFIIPVIVTFKFNRILKIILVIILVLSILTIFNLGSRSAFLALLLLMVFYTIVYLKSNQRFIAVFFIIILSVSAYYGNEQVKMRIDRIIFGVTEYINEEHPEQAIGKFNNIHDIAARFEMWRAGQYFINQNPILGFGPNEYANEIQVLIDKKLINSVAKASHPHNVYFMELFSKGFLGLIAMLLVLYYPAYIFIKFYKIKPYESVLGLSVIISFTAFSLTESAAFNNNNFSSMMLIYISIIFVSVFQKNNFMMSFNNE